MKFKVHITIICCLMISGNAFAQLNESITVTNTLFRQLEKAHRPAESPSYKDTSIIPPKLTYLNVPAQAQTSVTPLPIAQANLKMKDKLNKLYKSYAKLGFGNYTNFLGEYYFNAERARDYDYGIHVKHFSSAGGIDNVGHNGFSNDAIDIYGKKLWDRMYGKISAGYERNMLHYYGFNPNDYAFTHDSTGFNKKNYRQIYNIPYIKFETGNWRGDTSKLRHSETLLYRPFFDRYNTSEHYVAGSFAGGKFRKNEFYSLGASFDVNAYSMKDTTGLNIFFSPAEYTYTSQHVNGIIKLNPSVNTNFKQLKLRVGIQIAVNADNRGARFYFYPDIDLSYSLFNNMFIPYFRIGGNLQRNSLYSLTRENPFILNSVTPPNTNQKIEFMAGFKGSFGSRLSFNIGGSYSVYENYLTYLNDYNYSVGNRFTVAVDNMNIARINGQMLFQSGYKWHVLLTGNYYIYETGIQKYAWHKPNFDADLAFIYNLGNKLIGRVNTSLVGTRHIPFAPDMDFSSVPPDPTLPAYVDADLQLEYRYTSRFSIFLNLNNIASQRYEKWYNYRMQTFNVLGGLTYSF